MSEKMVYCTVTAKTTLMGGMPSEVILGAGEGADVVRVYPGVVVLCRHIDYREFCVPEDSMYTCGAYTK